MGNLSTLWARVRGSLWFLPSVLTALSVGLAFFTIGLDRRYPAWQRARDLWFVFEAGAEGARGVLSAIAGSIITVTGVVFSITIVVLQLASTQFTPRVLRSFTEDRATQVVLGVFIGTFTYSLLVLRTVRSAVEDLDRFVPSISVTVAVGLAMASVGVLIFFINHIASSIRAEIILQRVSRDALAVVDQLFPETLGRPVPGEEDDGDDEAPPVPEGQPAEILAEDGGYLQVVDEEAILRLAEEAGATLRMEKEIGDFVLPGEVIVRVWPRDGAGRLARRLRDAHVLGSERTRLQDVERGIIELTDIGVRALSPGVNDPTTAIVCIDRLSEVLGALGTRRFPARVRAGEGGARVMAGRPTFDRIVRLAYSQLRHHGAGDPAVAIRLLESLARLVVLMREDRRVPLVEEMRAVLEDARRRVANRMDLERIEGAARHALEQAGAAAEG